MNDATLGIKALPRRRRAFSSKRDLLAEGRALQNVVDALRQVLNEHRNGCLEGALKDGVEASGVPSSIFDDAVEIMIAAGMITRINFHLHSRSTGSFAGPSRKSR